MNGSFDRLLFGGDFPLLISLLDGLSFEYQLVVLEQLRRYYQPLGGLERELAVIQAWQADIVRMTFLTIIRAQTHRHASTQAANPFAAVAA